MRLMDIKVRAWMSDRVLSVPPGTPIVEAHKIMTEHKVRRLPVIDRHGKLHGIVTRGDVREASPSDATTLSIWEMNYLWAQLKVDEVMTRNVFTISADAPISEAAGLMLDHKISGIPVVDGQGSVIGIITESDLFRMLVRGRMAEVNPDPTTPDAP